LRQAKKKYTKKERRNIKQRGPEEIVAVAGAKVQLATQPLGSSRKFPYAVNIRHKICSRRETGF